MSQGDAALGGRHFDVLVIGGGITGAGVALDAASRGLSVALVDRGDLASGTSSKSSKLVHGGLRYLQQREFRLVHENLTERHRLLRNAPHLVRPLPFLVPLIGRGAVVDRAVATGYTTALWAYDLAGGLRIGHRHRRVSAATVLEEFPGLRADLVSSGFVYYDAAADDARLTLAVALTAVDQGATVATYTPVTGLRSGPFGRVAGVLLADGGEVAADVVVNATGVWSDKLRDLDGDPSPPMLRPAKGSHLTVARDRLPCQMAAVLPAGPDGRSVFVIPWGEQVYVGTTDTDYTGPLDDPQCSADDVAYLLAAVNAVVRTPLVESDVTGTWAGLRPLVAHASSAATADLSRRHRVTTSPSGVITVTGGKLTTYRRMAADTVDQVVAVLGRGARRSPTARMALRGAAGTAELRRPGAAERLGVEPAVLDHLVERFGGDALRVVELVRADPDLGGPLVPGLAYLRAEAVWAARHEMVNSLDDVLSRRTRALILARDAAAAAAVSVAALLAPELGWDQARCRREVASFRALVDHERSSAGLVATNSGGR